MPIQNSLHYQKKVLEYRSPDFTNKINANVKQHLISAITTFDSF